jgi:hypothetical protein
MGFRDSSRLDKADIYFTKVTETGNDDGLKAYFDRIGLKFREDEIYCKSCKRFDAWKNRKRLKTRCKAYDVYVLYCRCGNEQKINLRHTQELVAK